MARAEPGWLRAPGRGKEPGRCPCPCAAPWGAGIIWSVDNAEGGWAGASDRGPAAAQQEEEEEDTAVLGWFHSSCPCLRTGTAAGPFPLRAHLNTSGFPLQTFHVLPDCLLLVNTQEICPGASTPPEQTVCGYLSEKKQTLLPPKGRVKKGKKGMCCSL